ncbi:MAG: hypothetical protein RR888_09455 [Akkermansia sp.]
MSYITISQECLEEMRANGSAPIIIHGEILNFSPVDSGTEFWDGLRKYKVVAESEKSGITAIVAIVF